MPPRKDPNKPKGRKSSYAFFVQDQRVKHGASSFTEFTKACAAKWHSMDESDKTKFAKLQEEDKIRYQKEMENYNPPGEKKRRRRKKKDKSLPKRAMSAFMYFSMEKRPKLREENANATVGELAKMLGAAWRIMSDDQKAPYEEMTRKDRARYEEEMKSVRAGKKVVPKAKKVVVVHEEEEDDDDEEDEEEEDDSSD